MATAIVSPKFQIVFPREIRERLDLRPGQVVSLVDRGGVISVVPQRPISELRGIARGVSCEGYRDETDRFRAASHARRRLVALAGGRDRG